ncbi:hypothetical protein KM043_013959 [Ampulex compressa]|nr:hypothetical protein KM043_013959 [Ampulex compressa]
MSHPASFRTNNENNDNEGESSLPCGQLRDELQLSLSRETRSSSQPNFDDRNAADGASSSCSLDPRTSSSRESRNLGSATTFANRDLNVSYGPLDTSNPGYLNSQRPLPRQHNTSGPTFDECSFDHRVSDASCTALDFASSSFLEHHGAPSLKESRCLGSTIALGESTFDNLALDVSYAALGSPNSSLLEPRISSSSSRSAVEEEEEDAPRFWEDLGVVEYLERRLGAPDDSTPEERVEALREVLSETDIHEGDGDLSDFIFHVARTKHGKIYIRVIRTLLLNRGRIKDKWR